MSTGNSDFDYKAFRKDWDILLDRQKYKEAEKLCHEGLAQSPLDQSRGRLYNHLGYLYENYLDDKTFDDILEHYVLSLQVDESNANSHYNLANFLLEQGMQHLLRGLELNPNHTKANKRYANLTPIKTNTTLELGGTKYQTIEVTEDGVKAIRLKIRNDGAYEQVDDDTVLVEVGAPEKVVGGNKTTGRSTNSAPGDSTVHPLNIDDPNSYNSNQNRSNQGCCNKCIRMWYVWLIFWILALAGVAGPVLGYMYFNDEKCEEVDTVQESFLTSKNSDNLDVLFLLDCAVNSSDVFTQQLTATKDFLSTTSDDLTVNYAIHQYCSNQTFVAIPWTEYTGTTDDSNISNITQATATGADFSLESALRLCEDKSTSAAEPYLCVPFVTAEFDDVYESFQITASSTFADIYLSFILINENIMNSEQLYAVLGSFATSTECVAQSETSTYDNSWWATEMNCDDEDDGHEYCPHCLNHDSDDTWECGLTALTGAFSAGISQKTVESNSKEICYDTYEMYYFYAIGAGIPMIIWVFVVMVVLCRNCCNASNRNNLEEQVNNGDQSRVTAYV